MQQSHLFKGLYVITDCERLRFETLFSRTEQILAQGVPVLQYRDKNTNAGQRLEKARLLRDLCRKYDTVFLVNDDVRLALDIDADGVHLGQQDMSCREARQQLGDRAIIGISCNNQLENALTASSAGADYIAFGAFFSTQTKNETVKASPELLRKAVKALSLPIIAIGGITPENGGKLLQAGADMLAVVGSVYDNENPRNIVLRFKELFN